MSECPFTPEQLEWLTDNLEVKLRSFYVYDDVTTYAETTLLLAGKEISKDKVSLRML